MKCCNPSCNAEALMMPRVKTRALTSADDIDALEDVGHKAVTAKNKTLVRQRAMAKACDLYRDLACCDGCVSWATERVRELEDGEALQMIAISAVLLDAVSRGSELPTPKVPRTKSPV